MIKKLTIKDIETHAGTQQRIVDDEVVKRYAAMIAEGDKFPAVEIISDGKVNYLIDGFHRLFAHQKLKKDYIEANIEKGTKRDAIWASFSVNKANGFPRQPGTAKEIIEKILADNEWSKTSQVAIAKHVGVTEKYVRKVKEELEKKQSASSDLSDDRTAQKDTKSTKTEPEKQIKRSDTLKVERKGTEYEMKPKAEPKIVDSVGREVPKHLLDVFKRVNEFRDTIQTFNELLRKIKEGKTADDKLYAFIKIELLEQEIGNIKRLFRFAMPYAICRFCGADPMAKDCKACNGNGFLNEIGYKAVPPELK